MNPIYAALEIGTTRTLLAVAQTEASGRLRILCHAEIPSSNVRKSEICNIDQARDSIRSVLRKTAEAMDASGAGIEIGNAYLVVSGAHVQATHAEGNVPVCGKAVDPDLMEEVARAADIVPLADDRELLDFVKQDYVLDGRKGLTNPEGMSGNNLKLNVLRVHADRHKFMDARNAADAAHLEICEGVFAATCAADAVLEDHEKRNGVLVLDLGGGTTGYAAYSDGYLAAAGVIGVGGDHITNDIARAFQMTNAQAEEIKRHEASADLAARSGEEPRVKVAGASALMRDYTISRHALKTVVNARVTELFDIIREKLEAAGLLGLLHAGCVLTGGGAALNGIDAIAERVFGCAVRIGRPLHIDGLEDVENPASFAAISGALLQAQTSEPQSAPILSGLFKKFFS